ncbi:hypothetical protein QAD02_010249 [Eretmocerus hayati]|uniref:Uncharacterized protein n=1 Tax=Eretmocerus hayati TaxID=131215 RepID=A0ACC2NBY6_9HYME|nr:hypothetical protein QAD02_010249 [Eretmocerus hayati]
MAALSGMMINIVKTIGKLGTSPGPFPGALSQTRQYAHRKGYRLKLQKKKTKKVVVKPTHEDVVRSSKKMGIIKPDALRIQEEKRMVPADDVYYMRFHRWKLYTFEEAIQCHREWLHPTMYDSPSSIVKAYIELNFRTRQWNTKPVEPFQKILRLPHKFDHGEQRKVAAFCKTETDVKDALDAGATLAGGTDIIKMMLKGEISHENFDVFVAQQSIMPEILPLRGLLKTSHPNVKKGTIGVNMKELVALNMEGIKFRAETWDKFPRHARTNVPIGKLDMPVEHLAENLHAVLKSILEHRPKRPGSFITRVRIQCRPSRDRPWIDHNLHVVDEAAGIEPEEQKGSGKNTKGRDRRGRGRRRAFDKKKKAAVSA